MTKDTDRLARHNESQKQYVERMKEDGYMRLCIWVPNDASVKRDIRNFAESRTQEYLDELETA